MRAAAIMARIGHFIMSLFAGVLILTMCAYGGYSLWDSYMINQGAFLSQDLLKYKPASGDGEEASYSLEELAAINPDTRGWLTVDQTHIDYPVVQGEDDMFYVNADVFKEFSLSGAIFLSCLNSPDFSDSYSLIYGHHMDNGGMFGDVLEFVNEDYFERHQTGTLYLSDATYSIRLFACMEADGYDHLIYNPGTDYDLSGLLDYLKTDSTQYREIGVTAEDKIIGMSTCVDAVTNGRVVLFGRLEERKAQEGGVEE